MNRSGSGKDVEQVYIGKRVAAMQKKKEAANFKSKEQDLIRLLLRILQASKISGE